MQIEENRSVYVPTLLVYKWGIKVVECEWRSWRPHPVTGIFIGSTAFTYNQPFSVNHVNTYSQVVRLIKATKTIILMKNNFNYSRKTKVEKIQN